MDPLAPTLDSGSLCRNHCNMTHLVATASANHDGHHRVLVVRERVAVTLGERGGEGKRWYGSAFPPSLAGERLLGKSSAIEHAVRGRDQSRVRCKRRGQDRTRIV
jgi:hypothetical protein